MGISASFLARLCMLSLVPISTAGGLAGEMDPLTPIRIGNGHDAAALDRHVAQARGSIGCRQRGTASYYGEPGRDDFIGRQTANQEIFTGEEMTAAHRTLPFGTRVRVTTGSRSVEVRINDRGPYVDDRIIDLSAAAARELGIAEKGVAKVTLDTCI